MAYNPTKSIVQPTKTTIDVVSQADRFARPRRFILVAAGVVTFGIGLYTSSLYTSYTKTTLPEDDGGRPASSALAGAPAAVHITDKGIDSSASNHKSMPETTSPSSYTTSATTTPPPPPPDPSTVYDTTAPTFDATVSLSETLMGINRLRRRLARQAHGHVLETAAGTGRNTGYYRLGKCDSVTLVDRSEPMLDVARRKWVEAGRTRPEDIVERRKVRFWVGSVEGELPGPTEKLEVKAGGKRLIGKGGAEEVGLSRDKTGEQSAEQDNKAQEPEERADGTYDTVIQTMGLCSTNDPDGLLRRLGQLVRPGDEGGQILLLEHGRSHYAWLNRILDAGAGEHARRHGCWWNRDVGAIVERSGLQVQRVKRYHFGTTWWVELTSVRGEKKREVEERSKVEEVGRESGVKRGGQREAGGADERNRQRWWAGWL